jgi:shikimate kinase
MMGAADSSIIQAALRSKPRFGPVLVGMPGSGKTTVGALVAQALAMVFIDLDAAIAEQTGESVAGLIVRLGEDRFREIERRVALEALGAEGAVVSTGGGTVLHEPLHPILRDRCTVWLDATPAVLAGRIVESDHPLLTMRPLQRAVDGLLVVREPLYRKVSSQRIMTDNLDPASVASQVLGWFRRSGVGDEGA